MDRVQTKDIRHITVVGAGTMGHGIGQDFARAGFNVRLYDVSKENLEQAIQKIEHNLGEQAAWGLIPAQDIEGTLDRIHTTTSMVDAVRDADLVVEAVFEDLDLKRRVFRDLDRFCPEHTILGSNTSSFMPSMLASATERPDRVLVIHYFFPPHLMPLVEIVRSETTSDETVKTVYEVVRTAGKSPIVAQKEAMGFIANRLQVALLREALYIVDQGIATAQDVDVAVKRSFGRRLAVAGPFEMIEVQDGWDVAGEVCKYILPDLDASKEPSPVIDRQVARGELGEKTGKGFYTWTAASLEIWNKKLTDALAQSLLSDVDS